MRRSDKLDKSLFKDFSKYVSLNILGQMSISFYILADTYFIAKALGATGLAALNLSIAVFSIINGLGLMIGVGGGTRYSILKTKKEKDKANSVFSMAMI